MENKGFSILKFLLVCAVIGIIIIGAVNLYDILFIQDNKNNSDNDSLDMISYKKNIELTVSEMMVDIDYTGSPIICQVGKKIKDDLEIEIENNETYCWDTGNSSVVKKVLYTGDRITTMDITVDTSTGNVTIK